MPASMKKYERQSCRKERLKNTRKSDTKSTVQNTRKFQVKVLEPLRNQKRNKQLSKQYPKGQAPFNPSRVPAAMYLMFCQFILDHIVKACFVTEDSTLPVNDSCESWRVNRSLPASCFNKCPVFDDHMMTPFRIIHTCISFPNLVGVFM